MDSALERITDSFDDLTDAQRSQFLANRLDCLDGSQAQALATLLGGITLDLLIGVFADEEDDRYH